MLPFWTEWASDGDILMFLHGWEKREGNPRPTVFAVEVWTRIRHR
jgi:hypothetical protein